MKVLQVNCVYRKGSTGKIVYDIHTELLNSNIESIICYGRGELIKEKKVYKTCGELYSYLNHIFANLTGIMYGGCWVSTNKLIKIIKKEKPDVVHLHCINGYFVNIYKLVNWLKQNRINTVLTLHAEFMYTGGCGHSMECSQWKTSVGCGYLKKCPVYRTEFNSRFDKSHAMWKRMKTSFEDFNKNLIIVSVSPWLMNRAKQSPILRDKKHYVIFNGLDTTIFHPRTKKKIKNIREKLGVADKKIIFHATPNFNDNPNNIKGGYYILQLAKRMPNVLFLVAGPKNGDFESPENLVFLGTVKEQKKLAELYSIADVTVITSKRETFSMVTAESLCCGTPIVGFVAGGPESIALKEYSRFVEYGNVDKLQVAIEEFLARCKDNDIGDKAMRVFDKKLRTREYIDIYRLMICEE